MNGDKQGLMSGQFVNQIGNVPSTSENNVLPQDGSPNGIPNTPTPNPTNAPINGIPNPNTNTNKNIYIAPPFNNIAQSKPIVSSIPNSKASLGVNPINSNPPLTNPIQPPLTNGTPVYPINNGINPMPNPSNITPPIVPSVTLGNPVNQGNNINNSNNNGNIPTPMPTPALNPLGMMPITGNNQPNPQPMTSGPFHINVVSPQIPNANLNQNPITPPNPLSSGPIGKVPTTPVSNPVNSPTNSLINQATLPNNNILPNNQGTINQPGPSPLQNTAISSVPTRAPLPVPSIPPTTVSTPVPSSNPMPTSPNITPPPKTDTQNTLPNNVPIPNSQEHISNVPNMTNSSSANPMGLSQDNLKNASIPEQMMTELKANPIEPPTPVNSELYEENSEQEEDSATATLGTPLPQDEVETRHKKRSRKEEEEYDNYDFGPSFHVDLHKLKSKEDSVIQGEKYRFTVLTERLIRMEYSPTGEFNDYATELVTSRDFDLVIFNKTDEKDTLEIETTYFKLTYTKNQPFEGTTFNPTKNLKVVVKGNNVTWYYHHPEARNYYGSNISAEPKATRNEEQNKGLFSLDGMVSFDDSKTYRINELGNLVPHTKGNLDIYLFVYYKDFGQCVNDYFRLTGFPALIPRYALGNWWSRDKIYTTDQILKLVDHFEKYDIPLSVFLFDKDWHVRNVGSYQNLKSGYTFNTSLIPNSKKLTNTLHKKGIRVGVSVDFEEGIYPHEENYQKISDFLGYKEEGIINIDPLNPKILDVVLKYLLEPLESLGVDFFWNDAKEFKNLDKMWIFNHYVFSNLERNPAKRGMILARNSLRAAHRYPVLYSGEIKVSWENFMSIPFFNLSASNIGACWWSHDIGGYDGGIEDPELYIRSVQLGVFSPILRFHAAGGKYYKREPWKWDTNTSTIVANYLRLRHKLTSYLYTEAYKYYKTGSMIFQPLYYYLPKVYDDLLYRNEYFFGSELLVAPIVNKKDPVMNRTIHRFYLPEGMWYEYTTGKKYVGNKKYVSFYKEEDYPIFARRGSIIPLSNKSNVNNTSNPTDIEIHVFPGQNNTYRMYEDDGISSLYKEGYYLITEIDYNYLPNNYTLIIRSLEGKSGIVPDKRNYKIRFRNTKFSENVVAYFDDHPIEVQETYVDNNDFIVQINDVSTVGQLTINCRGRDIEIDAVRVINEDIDLILSDLQIETTLKEKIANILFSEEDFKTKRIRIRKLKKDNLDPSFIKLFLKLLEYIQEI